MKHFVPVALLLVLSALPVWGQQRAVEAARQHLLRENASRLDASDLADLEVTDHYTNPRNGLTHLYLRQRHAGIPVFNGTVSVTLNAAGEVVYAGDRTVSGLVAAVNTTVPALGAPEAVTWAADALGLVLTAPVTVVAAKGGATQALILSEGGVARAPIEASLVYEALPDGAVRLAWHLVLHERAAENWWSLRIDAEDGRLLGRGNWVQQERWPGTPPSLAPGSAVATPAPLRLFEADAGPVATGSYAVFPAPVESPRHGERLLIQTPADPTASPFGWHDTNAVAGAEFTITRGNNAFVYEDTRDRDGPGRSAEGTASLVFDFPLDLTQEPETYQDASLTNLFYWNNIIHDVLFNYGFDEAAGNFQAANYSGEGRGGDPVRAEGQDGGGSDNATFSTPPDGRSGRMQMFLWLPPNVLDISTPANIAGPTPLGKASFGPRFTSVGITAQVVLADDGTADPTEACSALVNGEEIAGKIALIDRGQCFFVDKVQNAQDAGAVAVLIANNTSGQNITLGAPDDSDDLIFTIPAGMISQNDGVRIKNALPDVTVTARTDGTARDGSFDNGIVVHEYAHGVSNRLVGGPSNADCLGNFEQGGEGWSDWLALALTATAAQSPEDRRGIATYAVNQPLSGNGLRRAPYTTSMAVNDATYGEITQYTFTDSDGNLQVSSHSVGFVLATILWDFYWALVDQHGFDDDLYHGTGGNNKAIQLVLDGLKMQPCTPGFVDVRDAILAADEANYGGENQCAIWQAFARRGLGEGADQGSVDSVTDGLEDFNVPEACMLPVASETDPVLPNRFALKGNYPNPFNPTTTLQFDLPQSADVEVRVYDLLGRLVLHLPAQAYAPGSNETLQLDATALASGVYLYHVTARMQTQTVVQTGRMTVLK